MLEELKNNQENNQEIIKNIKSSPDTSPNTIPEIRIAVGGNIDAGKSSFVGVMTQNVLDNGRGYARSFVMKHKHELESGRTSVVVQHYIRNEDKIIEFTDLAGHEKYLKTTIKGISGCLIDYVAIIINANTGIQLMTREHISLVYTLRIPMFIVYTKTDLCPPNIYKMNLDYITTYYKKKMGLTTTFITNDEERKEIQSSFTKGTKIVPLFSISNVSGNGVELVKQFIKELELYTNYKDVYNETTNFIVSKSYIVNGIGLIISGVMKRGTVKKGDILYIGPNGNGFLRDENNIILDKNKLSKKMITKIVTKIEPSKTETSKTETSKTETSKTEQDFNNYYKVVIKNIHNNFKESVDILYAGQSGCFNIKPYSNKTLLKRNMIKKGMRLLSVLNSVSEFDAKIKILHNPSTITKKYQPTINCEGISQSVKIVEMDKEYLRSFDEANVRFKFMYKPEVVEAGSLFLFREGLTKGIGKIINVY
jgi:GTPase